MTSIVFALSALLALGVLFFSPFCKSKLWKATVTPLAAMIGSGFLVSAPLLARAFGGYATLARALLIVIATMIGSAIRYNIRVIEPILAEARDKKLISIE